MAITYRDSDGLNEVPVSQFRPLPVNMAPNSAVYAPATPTVVAPGTGWVPADTVVVSGPATIEPTTLTVTHTQVVTATVVDGGTGATPGAVTITGSTGTGTDFQATGTIDGDGVLQDPLVVTVAGDYTVNPTDITAEPVTGGDTSDVTVLLEMGVLTATVTTAGLVSADTAAVSEVSASADGVGATFSLAATELPSMWAVIGTPDDDVGANTVIGLLKQIAANTTP